MQEMLFNSSLIDNQAGSHHSSLQRGKNLAKVNIKVILKQ